MNITITRLRDNYIIPENKYKIKEIDRGVGIDIARDQLRYNPTTKETEKYEVQFEYYGIGSLENKYRNIK